MKRSILVVLLALSGASCGTLKYNRAWSNFESTEAPGGLEGKWKGDWKSDMNGHSGGLRCMLTRREEGRYEAWFHSTYAWILTFQYKADFEVEREGDTFRFQGSQDLGQMAGGVYNYVGTVDGDVFHATFEAENGDHGIFDMQRVE